MVTPDQVLIKSENKHQHDAETGTVHVCDFRSATFFRSVTLPQPVDVNSVRLDFEDGILVVSALKQGAEEGALNRVAPSRKALARKSRSRMP
jgi:HSP20 family molecular chaperone IbpA